MSFSTVCNKCFQHQNPYLDPTTNKVYCSDCDEEITNLTSFTLNQLKANKQYKAKSSKPFATKCANCKEEDTPMLVKDDFVCSRCKKPLNLTPIFKNMLKQTLRG